MIQISALNDSSSDESDGEPQSHESTKEAQEANGFALYNKALGLQRSGNHGDAERVFHQLLNSHLLMSAVPPEDPEKPGGLVQPGLILKYSSYKNLGSIAFQRHDLSKAMQYYLEAASLDSTDVSLWYKIGTVALDLHHLPLARVAFQQGLTCNQKHWPCLDQLCTVLYALNDYATCLYYICKSLERDPTYTKGLALRDQIFSEQPSFRRDSYHMFRHCNDSIHNAKVKKDAADKVVKEALTLREKKQELQVKPPSPILKFLTPLRAFTWKALGDQLIALYDHISERVPQLSMGCTIDITGSLQQTTDKDQQDDIPMDIETTKPTPSVTSQGSPPTSAADGGGTAPFIPADSSGEKYSIEAHAASDVSGQSQEQVQQHIDTLGTRLEVENGQGDAEVAEETVHNQQQHMDNQLQLQQVSDQQQQMDEQQQQVHPMMEESATAAVSSAVEDETTSQPVLDQSVAMETDGASEGKQKKRRGPKRKRATGLELDEMYGGKRRSARVRNTTKKKEEVVSVNYAELLQRFLPSSLTDSENDDESQDGVKLNEEETTPNAATPTQQPEDAPCEFDINEFVCTEECDVRRFLKEHEDNSGIVDILHYYLVSLAQKYHLKWPNKLSDVYVAGFERLRKHCCFPEILSSDASIQYRRGVGEMLLVYAELKLDQWLQTRAKISSTPKKSSMVGVDGLVDFPGKCFLEDMGYIEDMAYLPPIAGDNWTTYAVRANWMKSRYLILDGNPEMSIDFLDECTDLLTKKKTNTEEEGKLMTVCLPNCIQDNIISNDKIKEQKKSLERCQSLEEVQRLHGDEDYRQVVKLLLPSIMQPRVLSTGGESMTKASVAVPERRSQLELLFEALLKLQDFSQCVVCGAVSLSETWQGYISAKNGSAREEWTGLLIQILEILDKALSQGLQVLLTVERSRLVELTTILIDIIQHAMEGAEMETTQPLTTVLPWIVLYRLIKLQEDKLHNMRISTGSPARSVSPIPMMSSSMMLLETAHEYLGRHSWCCNSDGALLKLYVRVLKTEMDKTSSEEDSHPFQDDFQLALEQCFYCLYAHPNRRSKARHLQDHGVEEVPLEWTAAGSLFDFFKPKVVPEFDSYKANSMAADLESLFIKIAKIIPDEENPINTMESVQAYMEGSSEKAPSLPKDKQDHRPVVREIHYFLADFYFKNKEFGKAIKFYTLDICVCPERLDSWAGVALSRSGRLDLKLNACDSKTESPIYKNSISALRCFKRALEIDETNLALWIEYGSLAYTLHSHASRQLKQHLHLRLSDETKKLLRDKREEMLQLAGHCFLKASECEGDGDGEEWLVQYMLGKVAEKRHTEPGVYLRHYMEAAHHLYENEAKYPKKITYHNPPDLSLEALEMYYRLHASILKLLEKQAKEMTNEYGVLHEFVMKASDTPFVKAKEKKNSDQSDMSEFDSDGKSSSGQRSRLSSSGTPMSPAYMTPQDHDYIKKKSKKKKRNVSHETMSTETASEGEVVSGDDTNSSLSQSAAAAYLLKSLADLKSKDGATTTTTETSASEAEGAHTETESSQDESPCKEPKKVKIDDTVDARKKLMVEAGCDANKQTDKDATGGAESTKDDSCVKEQVDKEAEQEGDDTKDDSTKSDTPVPVGIVKVNLDVAEGATQDKVCAPMEIDSKVAEGCTRLQKVVTQDNKESVPKESDSEPEIIDLLSDSSDSPVKSKPVKPAKNVKKKESKVTAEAIKQVESSPSGVGKEDVMFIDLTVDSSDSESLMSTPPRRALHETPIKAKPSLDKDGQEVANGDGKEEEGDGEKKQSGDDDEKVLGVEPMEVDGEAKSDKDGLGTKGESKEKTTDADSKQMQDKTKNPAQQPTSGPSSEPSSGPSSQPTTGPSSQPTSGPSESTKKAATQPTSGPKSERTALIDACIEALSLCLSRFPQHYKSLYRLAQAYFRLGTHKNLQWSRDLLLGTPSSWQHESHMPSPALFGEHNKTKNLFQGIWRIPITEIDRSGSFPWHMYRSVLLLLEVLEHLQDHQMLLQVAIKLNKIPEQGKKYLRDMDRQYLSRQSYQLCLAVLQQQLSEANDEDNKLTALLAAHKVWQCVQGGKLQETSEVPGIILADAYKAYKGSQVESQPSVLEQAVRFCAYYNMVNKLPQTPTSSSDVLFPGRSPRDSWCGSPVRGSRSETMFSHLTSPSYHDYKTTPEFPTTTPPRKSDSGVTQDVRKPFGGLATHSLSATDFQSAYKEALANKPRDITKSKAAISVLHAAKDAAAGSQLTSATQGKLPATQGKDSAGVKISAVTGKPIVKLRTLSSARIKVKPSETEATSSKPTVLSDDVKIKSTSKYFESASKGHQSLSSSSHAVSLPQTAPHLHPVAKPTTSAASASVVQRLREALGTKKLESGKSKAGFTSKLSLYRGHTKQHGSHSNRPVSATTTMSGSRGEQPISTASMPPLLHSQSGPSGSHGVQQGSFRGQSSSGQAQQQEESSKKDGGDAKSNFMSSFLSFLGGESK